jgi:hypothetical protein
VQDEPQAHHRHGVTQLAKNDDLPLGVFDFRGVGWDCARFTLGRACWRFVREGFTLTASYKNLVSQETFELGALSPATTDRMILEWFAGQRESHTAGDWLVFDGCIMWLAAEGAEA